MNNRGIGALAPWAALLIAAVSAVYGYGAQSQRIDSLESQVRDMRDDATANTRLLTQIQLDLTQVKTKLDILVPTPPAAKEAHR